VLRETKSITGNWEETSSYEISQIMPARPSVKSGLNAKWNTRESNVMRSVLFLVCDRGQKLSVCDEFWNFEICI
jgi:hypothetical protein